MIRSEEDRGVVVLLDDRFARSDVRRLLPAWWHVETMPNTACESTQRAPIG
ncbi:MAG TPA: helicase C-terminal domain-containing protein [Hydrogenophaga sp.]|nr:helicase C-terminal domain-containing protein [Hydrogenophaga sp.]